MLRARTLPAFVALLPMLLLGAAPPAPVAYGSEAGDARRALAEAQAAGTVAQRRAVALEGRAAQAIAAADRTAAEAAALAARIQQAQAEIAANQARAALIDKSRAVLRAQLAAKQEPLVRLTAALQLLSRRPTILSLLRPGSIRDAIYLRAVLETMVPEIDRRTAALRGQIAQVRALQAQALQTAQALRADQQLLAQRRQQQVVLESRQRLASRQVSGAADREADHALALAEQAGDLTQLVAALDKAGALRRELAQLPGPVLRPATPGAAPLAIAPPPASPAAPGGFLMPVSGRLVSGFGAQGARGVTFAVGPSAQVVSPAAGRVAFAGPYPGYGMIVIVEHAGGWTTLVTGLAQLDASVGAELLAGSPLGSAAPVNPRITVELRHDGIPVNPLSVLRGA
jgi:septal ring factor EnvC (AmiA/AmiB activator)